MKGLQHLYNDTFEGTRWGSTLFRKVFDSTTKLPKGSRRRVFVTDQNNVVTMSLLSEADFPLNSNRGCHRVLVFCESCGNHVSAGRVHQHVCK